MTAIMKISQLVVATILLACAGSVQAETNTITSTIQTNSRAAPAQPKGTTPTNGWKSSVSFGLTIARGNTDMILV